MASAPRQQPLFPKPMLAKTSPFGSTASAVIPESAPTIGNIARPPVPNPCSSWPRADRAAAAAHPRLWFSPARTIRPDGACRT